MHTTEWDDGFYKILSDAISKLDLHEFDNLARFYAKFVELRNVAIGDRHSCDEDIKLGDSFAIDDFLKGFERT